MAFLILAQTPLPFDIVSDRVDPFNPQLLSNPQWGLQAQTHDPERFPVVGHDCRLDGGGINDAIAWTSGQSPCTSYSVGTTEGSLCAGHVNWFPIAYEGHLCWQDHHGGLLGDDDYNFRFLRDDRALQTAVSPKWVIAEFDSDETVDHFDAVPWWRHLHQLVDSAGERTNDPVQSEICGKPGYAIGLVSFDTAHGGHSELHPVYAFAIHVEDAPNDDTWAFFVRNWGNQGGCARGDYRLDALHAITLFFPRTGAKSMTFGPGTLIATNSYPIRSKHELIAGRGLTFSFSLPPPEEHAWVAGEVHLIWDHADSLPPPSEDDRKLALSCSWNGCWKIGKHGQAIRAKAADDDDDDDDWGLPFPVTPTERAALERAVNRLDAHQQAEYRERYRALRALDLATLGISRPVTVERIPAGTRPKIVDRPPAPAAIEKPLQVRIAEDVAPKQLRQLEALCGVLGDRIGSTRLCARVDRLVQIADRRVK